MEFRTLEEIAQFNARRRQELVGLVTSASPELRAWRPAPEKWSMQEHLEHVALAAGWFAGVFEKLTARAKQEGAMAAADTPRQVDCVPVLVAAGLIGKKFQSPAYELPRGLTPTESVAMLEQEQARIQASVVQFPALDTDKVIFFHPVAGVEFNLAQLWHFLGLHETLHLRHMRANEEAWAATDQVQRS